MYFSTDLCLRELGLCMPHILNTEPLTPSGRIGTSTRNAWRGLLGLLEGTPMVLSTKHSYHLYTLDLSIAVPCQVQNRVRAGRPRWRWLRRNGTGCRVLWVLEFRVLPQAWCDQLTGLGLKLYGFEFHRLAPSPTNSTI